MPAALSPATALYLQRAAGNRAVARMVARQRMVARCGPSGCACVGRGRGDDELKHDAVLEALRRRSLARSVAARSNRRTLTRCSGGGCTCGGRCHAGEEDRFDESEALRMRSLARSAMPIRGPPSKRTLARCPAGGCTCGGRCTDQLDEDEGEAQLRRRMLARKTGAPARRNPGRCDACKPPAEASARPATFGDADVADYTDISPRGAKAWKLANFDVDRNYVKQEHRDFLAKTIIPEVKRILDDPDTVDTEIAVVGEASTTYTSSHNLKLSECRAQCVMDIIKAQLGTKANLVFRMVWKGKDLALKRGHPDEKENDDDRRVTVIPVHKRAGKKPKCPRDVRMRASSFLRAKTACGPGGSISVNVGEESDPKQPAFRRFRWFPDSFFDTCRFRAQAVEAGTTPSQQFSLAKTDPDSDTDLPSWGMDAPMDRKTNEISLGGGGFKITPQGTWSSACAGQTGAVGGRLLPVGPVECGEVPQPKEWNCDQDKEEKCSVDDRRKAGKKFAAMLVRFSHDLPLDKLKEKLAPYLPGPLKWLLDKLTAGVTVCVVRIGSLDTTPRLTRTFLFTGLEFFGPAGLDEQWGVDKEAEASEPMKLAYDPDDMTGDSDFDSNIWNLPPEPAKLEIDGNHTATEHLSVGDIEFEFKGIKCHNDDSRTVRGMMQGVSAVSCDDIGPWVKYEPNRECSKDECPEEQRLDDHHEFEFKIGRASLAGMPSIPGAAQGPLDWANDLGCDVTAAFINIGSTGENAIHRKGIFIGKKKTDPAKPSTPPCNFSFGSGTDEETFVIPRQLARDNPGEALATSDFHGNAELDDRNTLTVHPPIPALDYKLKVPGGFDPGPMRTPMGPDDRPTPAPCVKLGAEGMFWPIAPVECGKAPMPPHMTAKDPDPLEECRKRALLNLVVQVAINRLKNGHFKRYVDALPTGTGPNGTTRPFLFFYPALTALKTKVKTIVKDAIFVGRNEDGTPVVAIVDMQVDAYHDNNGDPIVEVAFRSEPCAFDASGNAVYMQRRRCKEAFWYKGAGRDLRTPGHRPDTLPREPQEEPAFTA